jgi:hypothetical protein
MKECFPKENLVVKKGNYSEFFLYSKKDGDYTDQGEPQHNNQGECTDFEELIDVVNEGETVVTLMIKFPKTVSRCMSHTKLLLSNRKDVLTLENRKSKYDQSIKE